MTRGILLIFIPLLIIAASCSSRKSKLDRNGLIPEKQLVSILTDVQIADGLVSLPNINPWLASPDSITSYSKIIEKHGYTKDAMDKTMKFYFVKKPKKLIAIYDKVLGDLSKMEALLIEDKQAKPEKRAAELWTGKEFYSFPASSGSESTSFDVTLTGPTIYYLTLTATVFPDDQSANPRINIYSCHPDSVDTGKRRYIETLDYIKDGYSHTFSLKLNNPESATLHFRGCLYDFENNPDDFWRHAVIENISLYSSAELR